MSVSTTDFEMFTPEANQFVAARVNALIEQGRSGAFKRTELAAKVRAMCNEIEVTYPEVYDTEPQYDIADVLNLSLCGPEGWLPISRWDW